MNHSADWQTEHDSLVPPQTPEAVQELVETYLKAEFAKLASKNKLTLEYVHGGKPWLADVNHWNFEAAKKATKVCRAWLLLSSD